MTRQDQQSPSEAQYASAATKAGWRIGHFGSANVAKWWNPEKDDGSRYCGPNACRHICEDHPEILEPLS